MQSRTRHPLLTAFLALALCLSGLAQGHALAGVSRGGLEVVICAGGEARSIVIDARGLPVDPDKDCPRELCPDCVAVKAGSLVPASGQPGQRLTRRRAAPRLAIPFRPRRRPQVAQPRGPPTKA